MADTENFHYLGNLGTRHHQVGIYSNSKELGDKISADPGGLTTFHPDWGYFPSDPEHNQARINVHIDEEIHSPVIEVDRKNKEYIQVSGSSRSLNGITIPYLAVYLHEYWRNRDGHFTLHGVSVVKPAESGQSSGLLLLGDRGNGKSIAELCLTSKFKYKHKFGDLSSTSVSPDGELFLDEGVTRIGLRRIALEHAYPELVPHMFPNRGDNSWEEKVYPDPQQYGILVEDGKTSLEMALCIHYDTRERDGLCIQNISDQPKTMVDLNRNLVQYVTSAAVPFIGNNGHDRVSGLGFIPSLDDETTYKQRNRFIEQLCTQGIYRISGGNLREICSVIDERMSTGNWPDLSRTYFFSQLA